MELLGGTEMEVDEEATEVYDRKTEKMNRNSFTIQKKSCKKKR